MENAVVLQGHFHQFSNSVKYVHNFWSYYANKKTQNKTKQNKKTPLDNFLP